MATLGAGSDLWEQQLSAYAADLRTAYEELQRTFLETLETLARVVEGKDSYTRAHVHAVRHYAVALGHQMGLSPSQLHTLAQAALLHDIGKVAVPDAVLLKPSRLTRREFALIERHPVVGQEILAPLAFLSKALPLIRHHHERWDGRGYPDGLAGDAIPLGARIMAVADSFQAMTSRRPYRPRMKVDDALAEIERNKGAQFDPVVAAVFIRWREGRRRRQPDNGGEA